MLSTILSSLYSLKTSDIFSLLTLSIIIYVAHFYYRYFTRPNPLPGPIPLPVLGNVHQSIGIKFEDLLMSMHKKYGDMFELILGGARLIVVCRSDLIENMNIPSTKTKYPYRFVPKEGVIEYRTNIGIFNNINYKSWKYNRQFFTQAMMTPSFNNKAIEWTTELWNEMEYYWNKLGEDKELDLTKWMHRFTNDMIFKVSTGVNIGSIASYYNTLVPENLNSSSEKEKEKIEESEHFIQSVGIFLEGVFYFNILNKFFRKYVPFIRGKINNYLKNRDYLFDRILDIIKKRRVEIENTPLDQPLDHDMLTSYITANTQRDVNAAKHVDAEFLKPMTDENILGNLVDTMIGGTDTTTNLLCFTVYYLGHHPEVKQRLQQELDTVLGKDLTKPITPKDIEELQYCDAIIKEVYRCNPVVFGMGRVNTEIDEIGGYNWPKETSFFMFYSAIMKSKNNWTNPEKFDPDRFYKIEESDKYLLEKQYAKNSLIMFGGGVRICPGRKLAMTELKWLLAFIYRKYDIELVDKSAPLKYNSVIINISEELLVKVKPRKL